MYVRVSGWLCIRQCTATWREALSSLAFAAPPESLVGGPAKGHAARIMTGVAGTAPGVQVGLDTLLADSG